MNNPNPHKRTSSFQPTTSTYFPSLLSCFASLDINPKYRIYHKTQQVYTEKEIIALAAKAGVNANSIPDIHQSLVDDGLVEKEKIGGSNYCWSFMAKKDRVAQKMHQQTLDVIQELKPKLEEALAQLADAKRGREEEDDVEEGNGDKESSGAGRAAKLRRMAELEKRKTQLQAELESLKENDPAALADLEKELKLVTEAAHRWTDNIFECKSYLIKKRGMEKKEAMKILGITSTFDCKCGVPRLMSSCVLLAAFSPPLCCRLCSLLIRMIG